MVDISRETYERNGGETIVNNVGILLLDKKKHMESGLDHQHLPEITINH